MRWLLPVLVCFMLVACKDSDGDGTSDRRDCADLDPTVHPKMEEVCNGVDDDCDGQVDEDVAIVAYWDRDGDGFGDPEKARRVCKLPEDGVEVAGDCDDSDPLTHPDASEICDGLDNDCDLEIDEDAPLNTFYADADGDGHGVSSDTVEACLAPEGYAPLSDDCDDAEPTVYAGAPELCDDLDNDCDNTVDEDLADIPLWPDADGDGSGDASATVWALGCGPEPGLSADRLDCDDADPAVGPHAVDTQGNGLDEDCDGFVDEYGVPAPFATVDDALAAAAGAVDPVIQFDEGLHFVNVDLTGEDVTLAGEGCDRTTLYGDQNGSVVIMDAGRLTGLSLEGGTGSFIGPSKTDGGGLVVQGDVVADNVCVRNNSASRFGGGVAVVSGSLLLEDSVVADNVASTRGGGVHVAFGAHLDLRRTSVIGNSTQVSDGGGVAVEGGTADLTSCVIAGNTANDDGGGLSVEVSSFDNGYGSQLEGRGSVSVSHCTFHANASLQAGNDEARGVGAWNRGGDLTIASSVFTGHADAIDVIEDAPAGLVDAAGAEVSESAVTTVTSSAFAHNAAMDFEDYWYLDAVRVEPRYVRADPDLPPAAWDLRLLPGSELIDADPSGALDPDGSMADLGAFGGPEAGPAFAHSYTVDTDGDSILDGPELHHGLHPWADDAGQDPDTDGLTNAEEAASGSDPFVADTDADGVDDATEVAAGDDPTGRWDHGPSADAGRDVWGQIGEVLSVDGSASWDPDGDALTYDWEVVSVPGGSAVTAVSAPAAAVTTLTPDAAGTYTLRLTVTDGAAEHEDLVRVRAVTGLIVPDDAPSVQEAIDMASSGQAILIRPGTWLGPLDPGGKDLTLVGLGGREEVVLDAGALGPVLTLDGGEEITLARLTLTNGSAVDGAGIHASNATSLELSDVVVRDNKGTGFGGGLYATVVPLVVEDSLFWGNTAADGAGVWLLDLDGAFVRTTFSGNLATGEGGAIRVSRGGGAGGTYTFDNCVFQDNEAAIGAVMSQEDGGNLVEIRQGALVGNSGGSLLYLDYGRTMLMNSIVAHNDVTFVFDGETDRDTDLPTGGQRPLADAAWQNTGDLWFTDTGEAAALDLLPEIDPMFGTWTDDDDPRNDRFAPRPGSALIDAGFLDWTDTDGSRSDIGPAGGELASRSLLRFSRDADGDGMSDGWEALYGLDPLSDDSLADTDGDGLSNGEEHGLGTSPVASDSDADGVSDPEEVAAGSDPASASDNRPTVEAGGPYFALVGDTLALTGSASDPNDDPLTWSWRFSSVPVGSVLTDADLVGATTPSPSFSPDVHGAYVLAVTVSDGKASSLEDTAEAYGNVELPVPDAYPTVADAIAAALDGDVITLGPGGWDLALDGFPVRVVIAGAGVDQTYLQGTGLAPIVEVDLGETVELRDLTLTASVSNTGGAVDCNSGGLILDNVRAEFNAGREGGAMRLLRCTSTFTDVDVLDGDAATNGGGVWIEGGSLSWVRGEIARNRTDDKGGAIYAMDADLVLRNLVIHHNLALDDGGAIFQSGGSVDAAHLTVVANDGTLGALYLGAGTVTHSILQQNAGAALYISAEGQIAGAFDAPRNGFYANQDGAAVPLSVLSGSLVDTDARFVAFDLFGDGLFDDLHLRDISPMRDAGSGTDPDGTAADLGAYGGPDAPADFDWYYRDLDADGMADGWELEVGLDPSVADAAGDLDGDGLSNLDEYGLRTSPLLSDTDGDGVSDSAEISGGTNPLDPSEYRPVADAGPDQSGAVGVQASLSGLGSSDPNNDPLTYSWSLADVPGRSTLTDADLTGATSDTVGFVPDTPGTFELELVVHDGTASSEPDRVAVVVAGDVLVPEDYPSVASAIDAVAEGSAVVVGPGTWPTRIELEGRNVTLLGAGRDLTILDGEQKGPVFFSAIGGHLTLTALTVTGGLGSQGGGVHLDNNAPRLTLTDVTFAGNEGVYGGAVYTDDAVIDGSGVRFVDNVAARYGAGMYLVDTTLNLTHGLVAGNEVVTWFGGGIYGYRADLNLTNVIFSDNVARRGAAVYLTGTDPKVDVGVPWEPEADAHTTLDHVTATFNHASDYGAVMHVAWGVVTVNNSLFASNPEGDAISLDSAETASYSQTYTLMYDHPDGDFRNFAAGTEPSVAQGNVFADPALVDTTDDGDWTNDAWTVDPATSAAVDAGDPAGADLDGSLPDLGAFGGPLGSWVP